VKKCKNYYLGANGIILRGAVKKICDYLFWKDYSGSAALELFCFYKDEVLIEGLQCGVGETGGAIEDCAAYEY
jgi:hypothetical protein